MKVSRMPASGVYASNQGSDAVRIDSLDPQGMASSLPANGVQLPLEALNIPPVSIWAALVLALTDRTQTAKVLEAILHLAFPEMDVYQFLYRIGDPSQRITDDESDMLREKLRPVLFPTYNILF
ncbi:hypothetical protein BCR34DRAFT_560884 [Clohesyomyces aquaticus]|uniref:Uncharacterized protein n=1 Tax=Clohesyomyces aquaticus TaxID=1231657 RepID=A0A1Y1ZVG4_9PLEO|nr:hypothetical protein BCR34DRAFT_560884 [Clohesyomyces aquaticus]